MQLLVVTQGKWGQRIADHLRVTLPHNWNVVTWQGPAVLPVVLDDPDEFLPNGLPPSQLLLVLTESPGMTDLSPALARLCDAQAVIVPVDHRPWAPTGLVRQVRKRLQAMDVGSAFPMPFCNLSPRENQHPLIRAFAQRYGLPELVCRTENGHVVSCELTREAPCGNTRYTVQRIIGLPVEDAPRQAGLMHHYYPCWGGMEGDPVHDTHTLLHIAATMAQKSVDRALRNERGEQDETG